MSKRIGEIDSIRAIAALSVIMIHTSAPYTAAGGISYYLNQLARFAVPIFIIISGFSLSYADLNRTPEPCLTFYAKRLKKVIIPYFIWTFIFLFYTWATAGKAISMPLLPRILIYGQASYHLYFIVIIIQLYLVYPLLRLFFKRFTKMTLFVSFGVSLYYQVQVQLSSMKINLPIIQFIYVPFMLLFTWLFYFVAGMYLAKNTTILYSSIKHIPTVLSLWVFSFGVLVLDSKLTGTYDASVRPSVMLFSMVSFFLFFIISNIISKSSPVIERALEWVSGTSFFIYFSHPIILSLLTRYVKPTSVGIVFNGGAGMILLFILTSLLTLMLTKLAEYIPIDLHLGLRGRR